MISNEMRDFIIGMCESQYNLNHSDFDINNDQSGKLKFGWKRSDLQLTVVFSQKKIAEIIYHNFLDDFQTENMTEDDFTARFNDILAVRNIETSKDFHDIINRIIKSVNSGKLFGSKERDEIILDSEYRAKLKYIKGFFGEKAQEGKLFEEIQELQEAVNKRRTSFWTKHEDDVIEEIADCLVVAMQLKKTKLVINMIKGIVEKSSFLNATAIEKIIKIAKGKIDRTITRIENGEYGPLMIGYDLASGKDETVTVITEIKSKKDTAEIKGNAMTDEELKAMLNDKEIEDLEDKKKKILLFLSKNTPYEFRPKLLQDLVDIKSIECTQIVLQLILERKLIVVKKGQDRIYGASIEYLAGAETKKTKSTVLIGGSGVSMHAKGSE